MVIGLCPSYSNFDDEYHRLYNPEHLNSWGLIRAGDYENIPGAKEVFTKTNPTFDTIQYQWKLLIPLNKRFMFVELTGLYDDNDRSIPIDLTEFNEVWIPIVESMRFDVDEINKLPDYPIVEKNWTKISDKPKRFKHTVTAADGFVSLYDSEISFFDKEDEGWVAEIDAQNVPAGFIKMPQRLILFSFDGDNFQIPVTFYLGADAPTPDKWLRVIEGLLGTDSGIFYFGGEEPDVKIKVQKGVYKFRVYFGLKGKTGDETAEYWHIYLWPSEEKENNDVATIKAMWPGA